MKDANKLEIAKRVIGRAERFNSQMEHICKTDPWIWIRLGDQEFKLEFSYGSVRDVFRATGLNINNGDIDMASLGDMELMCQLLAAGLRTHHPDFGDVDAVAKLISMKHRVYYAHRIMMAMQATQPDLEDMEELISEVNALAEQNEEDNNRPLPEIVPSPISGRLAD